MNIKSKWLKWVLLGVAMLLVMTSALPGCAPEEVAPPEEEVVPPEEEEEEEVPAYLPLSISRSVSVTLDAGRSASAVITADGGTISSIGANGSRFTLSFPIEALLDPEEVTLTPLSAMEGLPLSGDLVAAVQLEPEGLHLLKPATLTIELPDPIPAKYLIGFAYYGTGERFHLVPVEVNETTLTFQLMHFCGIGAGTGTDSDCAALALAIGGNLSPQERAIERIAYVNATEKDPDAAIEAYSDILHEWLEQSVLPELNGADNWETFMKALSEFNKWYRHAAPLLGLHPGPYPGLEGLNADEECAFEALGDAIQRVLHKENALGICNTGPEDELVHKNRLLYLLKLVDLFGRWDELVWCGIPESLCTVSIDLKAVVPGTNIILGDPKLGRGETSEGRFKLIATVTDPGGVAYDMSELPCVSIFWESCCPYTLTVDQDGVVTGRNPGRRCIEASITGIDDDYILGSGTAEVMVTVTGVRHVIASISVDFVDGTEGRLARGLLFPGETARLLVTAKDKSGNPVPWPEPWDVKLVLFDVNWLETDHADCITVSQWEFSDQYSGVVSPSVLITAVEVGWVQPHVYVSGDGWSQDYGWKDVAVLPDLAGTYEGTFPVEDYIREHETIIFNLNWVSLAITDDPANEGYLVQLSGELVRTRSVEDFYREGSFYQGTLRKVWTGVWEETTCYRELAQTINVPYESATSYWYQLWKDGELDRIGYFLFYAIPRYSDPDPPGLELLQPNVSTCDPESPKVYGLSLCLYTLGHIRGYAGAIRVYFDLYR